jgi:hypothetical protein
MSNDGVGALKLLLATGDTGGWVISPTVRGAKHALQVEVSWMSHRGTPPEF